MARPAAVALAGFFPTPLNLVKRIAALVAPPQRLDEGVGVASNCSFLDPCAGEADAVLALITSLFGEDAKRVLLYSVEMEESRAEVLEDRSRQVLGWSGSDLALRGDSFRASFERGSRKGVSLLFLNPPYDHDREHGRLEQRFLARFTAALADGGVLVFVVPGYSLSASAEMLARDYEDLRCFRFPPEEYAAYKQVVLLARRRVDSLPFSDPGAFALVEGWAKDDSTIPELPEEPSPVVALPSFGRWETGGLSEWRMREVDYVALARKFQAWTATSRGGKRDPVAGVEPNLPARDLLLRRYPLATPPRPAHIAAGIASGLFNGARLEPNDGEDLPPLLVKGVFDREYRVVEEKTNEAGEVTSVVQVQAPKLVTTILDLRERRYHALGSNVEETRASEVARFTVADLLRRYGGSLMAVMRRQCPVLYDPRGEDARAPVVRAARRPFQAQAHAVRALVKLLRREPAAFLLGEIGSGKSTVALLAARTLGSRRPLVLCPPHLLTSWRNEVASVFPRARVRVLSSVEDVERAASDDSEGLVVSVLSREAAKLGHAWRGVEGACPRCGAPIESAPSELARKRARCSSQRREPRGRLARLAIDLAWRAAPRAPTHPSIASLLSGRFARAALKRFERAPGDQRRLWSGFPLDEALELLDGVRRDREDSEKRERAARAIVWLLLARADDSLVEREVRRALAAEDEGSSYESFAADLALLLPPGSEEQGRIVEEGSVLRGSRSWGNPWGESFARKLADSRNASSWARVSGLAISWEDSVLRVGGAERASLEALLHAVALLAASGRFRSEGECGEPLYSATPEPRRVALAQHVARYYPGVFDFLVIDEGHEYASDSSAQSFSAHRLSGLGMPTVLMTGSVMNGYAESLFVNLWALSPAFRREFERGEKQRFIDRYGYRKRVVEDRDEEGAVVEYGSQSDRVTRSERVVGNAPGVLPLLLLRHLLPIAVTLHKADLAIDLPACRQEKILVSPSATIRERAARLQRRLVDQIKRDRFKEGLAGKLWGQLAELPSYLDRATADVGNVDSGAYEVRYPEACGGSLVAGEEGLDSSGLLPKEEWLLGRLEQEVREGRNALVFAWHVKLLPRLARLVGERLGVEAPILYADKVPTAKRQEWIEREVVCKDRRVLVTNPVAIQTGLNNLVHFSTEVWMENPACNPIVFRQAIGRVDRIGQRRETRILFPIYEGTLQEQLYDLLARKVAVSISTDGLDPESALAAAGVGEDEYLAGLSIGKQIWALMREDSA